MGRRLQTPAERFAGRVVTGRAAHLLCGLADVGTLLRRLARARRSR